MFLFSIVLVRAPALAAESAAVISALSLAPLVLAIASLFLRRGRWHAGAWLLLALGYVSLLMIAGARGGYVGTLTQNVVLKETAQILLLALLALLAFVRESDPQRRRRHLGALCWAPVVYVAVNIVLHRVGIVAPRSGYRCEGCQLEATMLHALGVASIRIQFPLASGVNAFGPICAIALAVSATLALRGERRPIAVAGTIASLYAILAIDSRGALLFGLLATALVHFTPRARRRGLGWIAIALPVLPLLLVATIGALSSSAAVGGLSRTGDSDITTGTGRTVVWKEVAEVLARPRVDNVFGYGARGQLTTGASVNYAYLFAGQLEPLAAHAHNMLLQTGLDLGWVGMTCLLLLATVMLPRYARRSADPYYLALLGATLAVLLVGIVDVAGTPESPDSFAWWLMAIFPAMRARDGPRHDEPDRSRAGDVGTRSGGASTGGGRREQC